VDTDPEVERYRQPGVMTRLSDEQLELVGGLPAVPRVLCAVARDLLITPDLAAAAGLPGEREAERNIRPARSIVEVALRLHDELSRLRPVEQRVVGTCRHFAVVSTAFLIARGIPARARCGFATYFVPGRAVDHWVTEHWSGDEDRWVRIDAEIAGLGLDLADDPEDLWPEEFLTGGEAWVRYRADEVDPDTFGVHETENWGWAEIAGNLVRDLAALQQQEMLPWDEWGPMTECYAGNHPAEVDDVLDAAAAACSTGDADAIGAALASMPVPEDLLRQR
jgi:hypothetical protein